MNPQLLVVFGIGLAMLLFKGKSNVRSDAKNDLYRNRDNRRGKPRRIRKQANGDSVNPPVPPVETPPVVPTPPTPEVK